MTQNKNFIYLWISQVLSQVTVNLMNFLLLARLFTITGSSIATSLLWVSYALPTIFFGPIGAATVDIYSRRKMLMITNFLQALTVFIYLVTQHQSSIFLLFIVVLFYSFFNQFYVPAESASLPSLVPKKFLAKANSLFFITQQVSLVIGFGFAGVIQKAIGFSGSLIVCTILLFLAFVSVTFLPEIPSTVKIPKDFEKGVTAFFKSIFDGYRFIKDKKSIYMPLIVLISIQIALAIVTATIPAIATEILKVNIAFVGVIVVVPAGIGALLASLYISRKLTKEYRKKPLIELGLILLSSASLILALGSPLASHFYRIIISPILVIAIGAGYVFVNIPTITFLQEATPIWLRGRVFGNLWFLVSLATILPVIFSGVISEFLGVRFVLIIMALGGLYGFYYLKYHGQKILDNNWS